MDASAGATATGPSASLIVVHPSGARTRVPLTPLPFLIGRQADNHLTLRDNRASRNHARIVNDHGHFFVEDLQSSHGVYVNGRRIAREQLSNSDRIEFGFADSYKLIFALEGDEIHRIIEQIAVSSSPSAAGNLVKLRSLVEVARALQASLSTSDVLAAVVDAALTITGTERGFLLLRKDEELCVEIARDNQGVRLADEDLKVPMSLIHRALRGRRELLSMSFDPLGEQGIRPEMSVADLELRSVVCVPLVRIRAGSNQDTIVSSVNDTVGLLYLDSRESPADLSAGNRELLQTLALEASTILENARLLEEERKKQRMEEELDVAREIQRGLLPGELPAEGWFRAAGSSIASHQVGGDYFDLRQSGEDSWTAVIADVSGKGVSAALLASLLQGAFLLASETTMPIEVMMTRVNHFLTERTKGEKYATIVYATIARDGLVRWVNAGHPRPILLGADGAMRTLESTGMPVGLLEQATYAVEELRMSTGDKLVLFSDGLTDAASAAGVPFEARALRETIGAHAGSGCRTLHVALLKAVEAFTDGSVAGDDITIVVLEYAG